MCYFVCYTNLTNSRKNKNNDKPIHNKKRKKIDYNDIS